jgi:LPS-assembly protein
MMRGACARFVRSAAILLLLAVFLESESARAQVRLPTGRGVAELSARQQRSEGKVFFADGDVDIVFENLRLRADQVQLDTESAQAAARGNVRFEMDNQLIEADEAHYNLRTGRGFFLRVRGSVRVQRAPRPDVLLSPNPFYFEAEEVQRLDSRTYTIRNGWVTVCEPGRAVWKFYAPSATIKLQRSVRMAHVHFRLLGVPVLYLPYATAPVGRKLRHSGFLVPHFANTSRKGFVVGDSFYWAPVDWADVSVGAEFLSRRGWSQSAELRARPWENVRLAASYFGVVDRGLPGPAGVRVPQGGHQTHVELDSLLPGGWRAVADLNQLTSLTFRLAFAETFAEAVNSEARSTAFVTNNFRGLSLNFGVVNYKNFLSARPEQAVVLRSAPGVRFSSADQAPWKRWPVYFGFHAFADAVHRSEPCTASRAGPCVGPGSLPPSERRFETPAAVQRTEVAPRITVPLRAGPWLGVTPSLTVRTTHYGSQILGGSVVGDSVRRTTAELTVDVRPPTLARAWERPGARWKHVVEPRLVYRYVDGVNRFPRFLRFDESDILTDTNEIEYSLTQRFYRRADEGGTQELVSWRVAQKHFFDPTFGGALVPGQRNVFQSLNAFTPFAFADQVRRFSPVVSDVRVTPGGRYDAQFRVDYDTLHAKLTAVGTLIKVRPYRESFVTLAHFATQATPTLQPLSSQVRALVGWGDINRIGLNGSFGFSYDVQQRFLQNQVAQVSYNGRCCGIGFEFRRLALGPVRTENQFRVALLIANIGTFGNLRRQEKIF